MRDLGIITPEVQTISDTFQPFTVECPRCRHTLEVDRVDDLVYGEPVDLDGDIRSVLFVACSNCGAHIDVEHYSGRHEHPSQLARDLLDGSSPLAVIRSEISYDARDAAYDAWQQRR